LKVTGALQGKRVTIPHGINERFFQQPRAQRLLEECDEQRPFRLVYVSIIDNYKHQRQVAVAIAKLRAEGVPIALDLIGPAYPPALRRLRRTLQRVDPAGSVVRYVGVVPHNELHAWYEAADLCVFASSCEDMPNILLEGMAFGLPIACSNRGPMPEVLCDAGVYLNPENPQDIACALREMIDFPALRARLAKASFARARDYSWQDCARETFAFMEKVARAYGANPVSYR
jgi:glycosyltransferase involved in cell wall biosynthesis